MLVTEGVRDALRSRARMTAAVRRLLEARGFLEVPAPWRAGARAGTALSSLMCCQLTKGRQLPRCTHAHTPSERTPRPESAGRHSSKKTFCVCCPCMHAQQDSGKALLSTRAGRALVETRVLGRHAGGGGYGCIAINCNPDPNLGTLSAARAQVETPVLEAAAGGADARPFVTFHNALQQPFVLRIATGAAADGGALHARGGRAVQAGASFYRRGWCHARRAYAGPRQWRSLLAAGLSRWQGGGPCTAAILVGCGHEVWCSQCKW